MSRLIEILLPVDGSRRSRANLDAVRDELTARFGGVTIHVQALAEGVWDDEETSTVTG